MPNRGRGRNPQYVREQREEKPQEVDNNVKEIQDKKEVTKEANDKPNVNLLLLNNYSLIDKNLLFKLHLVLNFDIKY